MPEEAPQPISVTEHRFPQASLGCTILVLENLDTGAVHAVQVDWGGKTPTPEEQTAAEALSTSEEAARQLDYRKRGQISRRIMDRWAAYNDRKIISGEWGGPDLLSFFGSIGPVTVLLFSNGFGACRDTILAFDHPYATPQAKYDYLQIMKSEYPSLPVPTLAEIEAMGEE